MPLEQAPEITIKIRERQNWTIYLNQALEHEHKLHVNIPIQAFHEIIGAVELLLRNALTGGVIAGYKFIKGGPVHKKLACEKKQNYVNVLREILALLNERREIPETLRDTYFEIFAKRLPDFDYDSQEIERKINQYTIYINSWKRLSHNPITIYLPHTQNSNYMKIVELCGKIEDELKYLPSQAHVLSRADLVLTAKLSFRQDKIDQTYLSTKKSPELLEQLREKAANSDEFKFLQAHLCKPKPKAVVKTTGFLGFFARVLHRVDKKAGQLTRSSPPRKNMGGEETV